MPLSGTVAANKALAQGYASLMLVAVTFQGTSTPLLLSTAPLDGVSGPAFPGIGILPAGNYIGRIAQQDIEALQQRSNQGIDRAAKVTLHIFDADHFIWTNYCKVYGFRGATVQMALVLWQAGTTNFSTDAPIQFVGTCDMEVPQQGGDIISVTANNGHDTATVKLPLFPIQPRCPLIFPANATQRAMAVNPSSTMCPYSPDQTGGVGNFGPSPNFVDPSTGDTITDGTGAYIVCDFIRSNSSDPYSGCMPRLGNAATTSVAADGDLQHDTTGRHTGAFAGIEWSPGTYYAYNKNYVQGKKIATFSYLNSAIWGSYQNLLYGTQWLAPKLANIIESGNDTKAEAMICTGDIGQSGVIQVLVQGISLNRAPSGDNNLWWDFNNTGGRFGAMNTDAGYSNPGHTALGDPYGSIACIRTTFYSDIFTGFGSPTVQVLASGPSLWVYAPVATSVGSGSSVTVTFPAGVADPYIPGAGSVTMVGGTLSGANGTFTATSAAFGPPGTVTYTCSAAGSGTGGFIGYQSNLVKSNPAWVLLDILLRSNWTTGEIDMATFAAAGTFCDTPITYINQSGQSATHARFKCQFAIEQRKSGAEIIAGILRSFNGYFVPGPNGLLQLFINQTLADSQPAAITGSNFNTAISSIHADGTAGTGHVAFAFDESSVARIGSGDNERPDLECEQNATIVTPNQIYINFQDEDNQFVQDSLGEVDANAVTRSGGALQPGGSVIPETLVVTGICNFDQATRIANVYLAERQYGNEANDPRGTRVFTFGTTIQVEHLRLGNLVYFSWQPLGIVRQLFRVIKIQPATNFTTCKITIQWHNDVWYTDEYGQQPQSFYSNAGIVAPNRAPLPWQAFGEQPNVPSANVFPAISTTEWNFQLAELDGVDASGSPYIQLQIAGDPPIDNPQSLTAPPRVPVQATTASTGGSIPGGITLLMQLCAFDVNGNYCGPSGFITATIPAGTNTNTVTISGLGWQTGTAGYDLMAGLDHYSITSQSKVTPGLGFMPSSITLTSLPNVLAYGPPDLAAGTRYVQAKRVLHAGIIGEAVVSTSNTSGVFKVTIGGPPSGTFTNSLAGYRLWLVARQSLAGGNLPIVELAISSASGSSTLGVTLIVDRDPTALLFAGDVVVVSAQANVASATTIGDTNFVSTYAPLGVDATDANYGIRIVEGKGRYQTRRITTVTGGGGGLWIYTVDHPWTVVPDSTSSFIVEELGWPFTLPTSPFSASTYTNSNMATIPVGNVANMAILVQVLIGDPSGTIFSSNWRSPYRIIWLTGAQGTRPVTASGSMVSTDRILEFDTSSVMGTTDTLSVAITSTLATSISLTSGAMTVNGTYCKINSEIMFIESGGGTGSLTVDRGALGTTAATHSNGATVNVAGELTFNLLPIASVPNQPLLFHKTSTDINYVLLTPAGGDTLPDGAASQILADTSSMLGTFSITAPG